MTQFATRKSNVEGALLTAGIAADCGSVTINKAIGEAVKFAGEVVQSTAGQALYDQTVNLPCGILDRSGYTAGHAVECGIVHAIGVYLEWSIDDALRLCADILDDVNAHSEAEKVRGMIEV